MDVNDGHISGPPGQGPQSVDRHRRRAPIPARRSVSAWPSEPPIHPRLLAMIVAGRYHGMELDPNEFRAGPGEKAPSAASLSAWAQSSGMWCARACGCAGATSCGSTTPAPWCCCSPTARAGLLTGVNTEHKVVLHQGPARPASRSAGAGGRAAAERGLGRRAVLLRAKPRLRRDRRAVLAALADRPGAAGEAVAARDRHRLAGAQHPDHLPAVPGDDGGRQGADAQQLLDAGR